MNGDTAIGTRPGFLERLALHRPELRAWAMYDWANSAMVTVVTASIFPVYYYKVAAAGLSPGVGTQRYALSTTLGLILVAVLAPILGAVADVAAVKKKLLATFLGLGIVSTAGMFWIGPGDWKLASLLLVLANVGASGSFVFYDSLLPHVARDGEMDRLSTTGYALGFLGGGILLAIDLACIRYPQAFGLAADAPATLPARLAFLSVAIWWLVFSLPLFRKVQEPRIANAAKLEPLQAMRQAFARLRQTGNDLRRHEQAFVMLIAFLVYNDGISTIIKMATIYGAEIGIAEDSLLLAILLVQFVGVPFSVLFGAVASRIGTKPALYASLAIYVGISVLAYFMTSAVHFFALAFAVGMVQGGSQALSRSLFASLIPRSRSSEFFGFFAVLEKFAGILGPALFALAIQATGSSRVAIVSVVLFFVTGALLLRRVDVDAGRAAARAAAPLPAGVTP